MLLFFSGWGGYFVAQGENFEYFHPIFGEVKKIL